LGTDIKVGDTFNGNFDQILCQFDYNKEGVQQWHDSVVALWASWGVDMIKVS
jgi:alpha-galactosidase